MLVRAGEASTAVVHVTDACGGGAGIGLSIVRSVAEAHGGSVGVENLPLPDGGTGCRFTLTLPA